MDSVWLYVFWISVLSVWVLSPGVCPVRCVLVVVVAVAAGAVAVAVVLVAVMWVLVAVALG